MPRHKATQLDTEVTCPVCLNAHGATATAPTGPGNRDVIRCQGCGGFVIDRVTAARLLSNSNRPLTVDERAALSHLLRRQLNLPLDPGGRGPLITEKTFADLVSRALTLPTYEEQRRNFIRFIGNRYWHERINLASPELLACVGAATPAVVEKIAAELELRGRLPLDGDEDYPLTHAGRAVWRAIRRGRHAGPRALLVANLMDPNVRQAVPVLDEIVFARIGAGLDLHDSRAAPESEATRAAIEDAAVVLVGLRGAAPWWQAGYAEGLAKPTIYLLGNATFERDATFAACWPWDHPASRGDVDIALLNALAKADAHV